MLTLGFKRLSLLLTLATCAIPAFSENAVAVDPAEYASDNDSSRGSSPRQAANDDADAASSMCAAGAYTGRESEEHKALRLGAPKAIELFQSRMRADQRTLGELKTAISRIDFSAYPVYPSQMQYCLTRAPGRVRHPQPSPSAETRGRDTELVRAKIVAAELIKELATSSNDDNSKNVILCLFCIAERAQVVLVSPEYDLPEQTDRSYDEYRRASTDPTYYGTEEDTSPAETSGEVVTPASSSAAASSSSDGD